MKKEEEICWGIIGCGNVTELKSGPAFGKVPHSRLVAVMRRNAALAEDYARRHGVPSFYSDAAALIADPAVNAVYVATPPDTHALYAIQAMRAGKPVYVEKPMARTYAECLDMIQVSEQTGMPLYVAYYRRSLPFFLQVRQLIAEGAAGEPLTVHVKLHKPFGVRDRYPEKQDWHVDPVVGGAGHFYDLASHQLDFLDFLFGPIVSVDGNASNRAGYYPAEDTVTASFAFASGVTGSGSWCFVVDPAADDDQIEITCTQGIIRFPCFAAGEVELISTGGVRRTFAATHPENISYYLVQQVVSALRGEGSCVSTMHTAARTSRVLEEIVDSYYRRLSASSGIKK
jgi:predicted dehydrogenase